MTSFKWMIAVLTALLTSACGMPAAAPTASQIEKASEPDWDVYVVKVTPPIVRALASFHDRGFPNSFRFTNYSPQIMLRPGDIVGVSIYETGGSSLFGAPVAGAPPVTPGQASPPPAAAPPVTTTLPPQVIESDGQIIVPYAGRVRISGKTPIQAASVIESKLATQAVRPQVIVSLVSNSSGAATVGGEVNRAGLVPLTLRGEKLLDVIAEAGGPKFPATETNVRVMRGNVVASLPLQQILTSPEDNIGVQPNDSIVLVRSPKTFVVMGASPKVSQYNFDTEKVTVAEAIARAGGGIDAVSNLSGIFIFRNETTPAARTILEADAKAVDTSYAQRRAAGVLPEEETRIVYRIDLGQSGGYFLAQSMTVHDKDIILLTNAEVTELQKFLLVVRGLTGVYYDINKNSQ